MSPAAVLSRLFFAVPLSTEATGAAARYVTTLSRHDTFRGKRVSWANPGTLHVTLAFLGDQQRDAIPKLVSLALEALHRQKPFRFRCGELRLFPDSLRPRVLILEITDGQTALAGLHRHLETALVAASVSFDSKPMRPHLTLGRLRDMEHARTLGRSGLSMPRPPPVECWCDQVVLFSSILRPEGAQHTPEGVVKLAG